MGLAEALGGAMMNVAHARSSETVVRVISGPLRGSVRVAFVCRKRNRHGPSTPGKGRSEGQCDRLALVPGHPGRPVCGGRMKRAVDIPKCVSAAQTCEWPTQAPRQDTQFNGRQQCRIAKREPHARTLIISCGFLAGGNAKNRSANCEHSGRVA